MRMTAENELEHKVSRRLDLGQEHDLHATITVMKIENVSIFMRIFESNQERSKIQLIQVSASWKMLKLLLLARAFILSVGNGSTQERD